MKNRQTPPILKTLLILGLIVLGAVFLYRGTTTPEHSSKDWVISMEKAADKVRGLPEVDEFLKRGETRKTDEYGTIVFRPTLNIDREPSDDNPFWLIHVWDSVTEYNKGGEEISGHSATFGWYKVNAQTGELVKEP